MPSDADVLGDEPIWHDGKVIGWVTSGGYAHYVDRSLAQGYVPKELATDGAGGFEIEILGEQRTARRSRRSRCSIRKARGCGARLNSPPRPCRRRNSYRWSRSPTAAQPESARQNRSSV